MGCAQKKVKRDHEIWLIDGKAVELYRKIEGDREEIIPIKNNPDMKKFMCISREEADGLIDGIVEGEAE